MARLSALVAHANELLAIANFSDYCPNGLQVQGRPEVHTLIGGVTACQRLLDEAVERQADAVLVHHGYFWKGEDFTHGQQLQMDGAGETVTDGRPGSLIITAIVDKHPTIRKEGQNLVIDLHVSMIDALLGKKIEIETLDGKETIEIPEGMPVGHVIKLKGKGVSQGFMRNGDFLIVTHIDMPKKLSKKAKEMIEELRKEI